MRLRSGASAHRARKQIDQTDMADIREMTDATAEAWLEKAHILSEALPYMQRYEGKVVVVKYGGHAMGDDKLAAQFARDIVLLCRRDRSGRGIRERTMLLPCGDPNFSLAAIRRFRFLFVTNLSGLKLAVV